MSYSPKHIVLCSDGTGNTVLKGRGTNVWKTYEAVALNDHLTNPGFKPQVAFYDDGVGTEDNKLLKLAGGAFGLGLSRNVRQLYTALCRTYQPGDDIFLFGFSRGAYTVRVLAGLITDCGVIKNAAGLSDDELDHLVKQAYGHFRRHFRTLQGRLIQSKAASKKEEAAEAFRRDHAVMHDQHAPDGKVSIKFVGVWDTVAAIGLPFDHLTAFWNNFIYPFKFPDHTLSPQINKACHAVAIDDERHTFHPFMWDQRGEYGDRIEQVWFAGVHTNVGGGYAKHGLSLVTLDWMMTRAEEQGLRFVKSEREKYQQIQNTHDKLHDSRAGLAVYYRYKPRDIAKICHENGLIPAKVHVSVLERIAHATQSYAPGNLPTSFDIVTTTRAPSPIEQQTVSNFEKCLQQADSLPPLLERVKHWVMLRRCLHYLFLLITLAALAFAISQHRAAAEFEVMVPASIDASIRKLASMVPVIGSRIYDYLLRPLIVFYRYGVMLVGTLVVFYVVSRIARRASQRVFQNYWRKTLSGP